jgi:GH15 family glucan-1,4-alpha-glucosidase
MNIMEKQIIRGKKKDMAFRIGKMLLHLMEFFQKIKLMDGVYFIILKEIYIKEDLKMIKQMDLGNITMKTEEFILAIGLMITKMV